MHWHILFIVSFLVVLREGESFQFFPIHQRMLKGSGSMASMVSEDESDNHLLDDPINEFNVTSQGNDWQRLKTPPPYITQAKNEIVGIGGKTGYNYDVNKLKSNLVQKSVRQFKQELLMLLIGSELGNHDMKIIKRKSIEDKIAALVSANPVGTTTDSNLLEGQWEFAFSTNNAKSILEEARFPGIKRADDILDSDDLAAKRGPWKIARGKIDNPLHSLSRSIVLEELDDDESPFLVDLSSFYRGLWTVTREYQVIGLTRKTLQLQPTYKTTSLFGTQRSTKLISDDGNTIPIFELQIIYLDSDIMMCMIGGDESNLAIYTKNENWIEARRQNLASTTLSYLLSFESPLHLRRKLSRVFGRKQKTLSDVGLLSEEEYKELLLRRFTDSESTLTALRLGEYRFNEEEFAWEGKDDPFVSLSADERQELIKKMSIGEIKKAGYTQKKIAKRRKEPVKRRSFNRPDNKSK